MNLRKIFILALLVLIQLIVIFGVVIAMRLQYPNAVKDSNDVSWELTPTMTVFLLRNTPTSVLQPIAVFSRSQPCTYPSEYLINHIDELDALGIDIWIGDQKYTTSEALSVINGDHSEVFQDLFLQLYTAKINIRLGADGSIVDLETYRADSLVDNYSNEDAMTIEEIQQAVQLTNILRSFNTGVIGPGLCPVNLSEIEAYPTVFFLSITTNTPAPTTTETHTPTSTSTPTATQYNAIYSVTPKYTSTPTNTEESSQPKQTTQVAPSLTPQNTRIPPTQPPPSSTSRPPTDTPRPPTDTAIPPPPTTEPTDEPTPTTAPTKEPTPTLSGP